MKAVIQRVNKASVSVDGELVSSIDKGFLVLFGVDETDTEKQLEFFADKTAKLRIFCDEQDKMNLSPLNLIESGKQCEILVVSQFTLCADCKGQNRPSFMAAAKGQKAVDFYEMYCKILRNKYNLTVKRGIFGADMKVNLENDGPVTIIFDSEKL